jgi:hypothetical protein
LVNIQESVDTSDTIQVAGNGHSTNVTTQHIPASGKARNLTAESQMLLSGVQTIPEQLPLILTEGDAEDHESLAIIDGNEQLQVSTINFRIVLHHKCVNINYDHLITHTIIMTTITLTANEC